MGLVLEWGETPKTALIHRGIHNPLWVAHRAEVGFSASLIANRGRGKGGLIALANLDG